MSSSPKPYAFEEYATPLSLEGLREEWTALHEACDDGHPFREYEWNHRWLSSPLRRSGDRVFAVRREGECVGIVPVTVGHSRVSGLPLMTVGPMTSPFSDYNTILLRDGHRECFAHLLRHLRERFNWHVVYWNDIRNSPTAARPFTHLLSNGFHGRLQRGLPCPFVTLGESWEEYLGSLTVKRRWKLRRVLKEMQRLPNVRIFRDGDLFEEPGLVEKVVALEQKSRKGRQGEGLFATSSAHRFFVDLFETYHRLGRLVFAACVTETHCMAFLAGFRDCDRVYIYTTSFDPTFARYNPGTYCYIRSIMDAIDKGYSEMDLLRGGESYKKYFACRARYNQTAVVFANNSLYQLWSVAMRCLRTAKRLAGKRRPETSPAFEPVGV